MTTSRTENSAAGFSPEEELDNVSYVIDTGKEAEINRALGVILITHRCSSCREEMAKESKTQSNKEHISRISKCCSRKDGFIDPQMPIQEIIFRLILAGNNKAMKLNQLHYLLTEEWATPMNPKNIYLADLRKILVRDNYYGFQERVD